MQGARFWMQDACCPELASSACVQVAGDKIFAQPGTLTGSIGVITGG